MPLLGSSPIIYLSFSTTIAKHSIGLDGLLLPTNRISPILALFF